MATCHACDYSHVEPYDSIRQAILARDLEAVKHMLARLLSCSTESTELDVSSNNLTENASKSFSLLLAATQASSPEIFSVLWETFCSPQRASLGFQPEIPYACLHHAALKGLVRMAEAFSQCEPHSLARSPPQPVRGPNVGSQLLTALRAGHLNYIDFLISKGVDLNHEWPRIRLVRSLIRLELGDEELVRRLKWLLERGARVDGAGAVRRAVEMGSIDSVNVLLDSGANVDDLIDPCASSDDAQDTALIIAVRTSRLDMSELLIRHGADPWRTNSRGESAVSIAETLDVGDDLHMLLCNKSIRKGSDQ